MFRTDPTATSPMMRRNSTVKRHQTLTPQNPIRSVGYDADRRPGLTPIHNHAATAVVQTPATHFPCWRFRDRDPIPLSISFIPSHALCIRSYNGAAARDLYTRGDNETIGHNCGHPVVWHLCHCSRAGEFVGRHAAESSGQCRDQRASRLAGQHGVQCCCARGGAVFIRHITERQFDGIRLRVRSARRPHLSDSGGSRGYCGDNGTSRQHWRQHANRHA
jgi:hypothetical protein